MFISCTVHDNWFRFCSEQNKTKQDKTKKDKSKKKKNNDTKKTNKQTL